MGVDIVVFVGDQCLDLGRSYDYMDDISDARLLYTEVGREKIRDSYEYGCDQTILELYQLLAYRPNTFEEHKEWTTSIESLLESLSMIHCRLGALDTLSRLFLNDNVKIKE